jgi:Amt family ammonium transporter
LYYAFFPPEGASAFQGNPFAQLITQFVGVISCALYVAAVAALAWLIIKATAGMRVSREEELEGLDIGEHGNEAYHGFVLTPGNMY